MSDLSLQAIVFRMAALLIVVTLQGAAVAAAAVALGDRGPKDDGRLTLWPAAHLDVLGAAAFVLFGLGWARPVRIDREALGIGRAGLVLAGLAAAAALVAAAAALVALAAPALTVLPLSAGLWAAAFLRAAAALCLANALFGLLPVPPLPGGHLLAAGGVRPTERALPLAGAALLLLLALGLGDRLFDPVLARLGPPLGIGG